MILTLFIVSALFVAIGLFFFLKRKGLMGVMFTLLGILGIVLAWVVKWLYPEVN